MTTGNQGLLEALADAIAERVAARIKEGDGSRLLDVPQAAKYIGRTQVALRHMVAKRAIPSVRRDGRVYLDRQDLDAWIEMGKVRG